MKIDTASAFVCGFCACALLYFIAMPITGGWCISYAMEIVLGTISLCGIILSGAILLSKDKKDPAHD